MLLRKNHRHTGMDLRYELIRLACDNRASAQPFSRFGIFPVFPEPGRPSFNGDRERQLRFSRFTPFVESVRRNQSAPFCESLPERRRFIDGLSSGVDGPVSDLWICLVYINTLMIQRVLTEPDWTQRMLPDDLRALTPLIYAHVTPYGTFRLDMTQRLAIEQDAVAA
jgi:hypothetical protein